MFKTGTASLARAFLIIGASSSFSGLLSAPLNFERLIQNGAAPLATDDPLAALNQAAQVLGLPPQPGSVASALAAWVDAWRDSYNRPSD